MRCALGPTDDPQTARLELADLRDPDRRGAVRVLQSTRVQWLHPFEQERLQKAASCCPPSTLDNTPTHEHPPRLTERKLLVNQGRWGCVHLLQA